MTYMPFPGFQLSFELRFNLDRESSPPTLRLLKVSRLSEGRAHGQGRPTPFREMVSPGSTH